MPKEALDMQKNNTKPDMIHLNKAKQASLAPG
jgi:hypothetical protein